MQTLMIKIKKSNLKVFALLLVIILTSVMLTVRGRSFNVELFRSGQGWGYDIMKNNKIYIHQPYMPAIEGEVPFSNRQSAKRTGILVVRKIRNHKSPSITKEELQSILNN